MSTSVSVLESQWVVEPDSEEDLCLALAPFFEEEDADPEGLDEIAEIIGIEIERNRKDEIEHLFVEEREWDDEVERLLLTLLSFATEGSWIEVSFNDGEEAYVERWTLDEEGDVQREVLEDEDEDMADGDDDEYEDDIVDGDED